ncbi:MAG: CGNR zinc finger domain-containing protein [Alphaproteobacteria bacterium]
MPEPYRKTAWRARYRRPRSRHGQTSASPQLSIRLDNGDLPDVCQPYRGLEISKTANTPLWIVAPSEDLCVNFANTLWWRGSPAPTEKLSGFRDLLDWLAASQAVPTELFDCAVFWADADPEAADRLFRDAISLREAIYQSLTAAALGDSATAADFARLNNAVAAAPARTRLVRRGHAYAWDIVSAELTIPLLLTPVLWSAADLLARGDYNRLRRCANDQCLWLFIDRSKGGTRRWCDMSSCGNRAKSRRHYQRSKPGGSGEPR